MFGIGGTEILVILVVALLVLGPKSVPQIARTLGKALGEFRRVSTEFQRTLNTEVATEEHEKKKKDVEAEYFPETSSTKPKETLSQDTTINSEQTVVTTEYAPSNTTPTEGKSTLKDSSVEDKVSV